MRRRELMLLLAGALTARALHAQQKTMPVIGYPSSTSPARMPLGGRLSARDCANMATLKVRMW
jgi:hypothetical protein